MTTVGTLEHVVQPLTVLIDEACPAAHLRRSDVFTFHTHHTWHVMEVLPLALLITAHMEIVFQIPFQVIMNV